MTGLKKFLVRFFAVIGFIVCLIVALGIYGAFWGYSAKDMELPGSMILTFNTGEGLSDHEGAGGISSFFGDGDFSAREAVYAIQQAAEDPRVKAIAMRVDSTDMGIAKIQQLREAITYFRGFGKKTYVFADTFGFESGGDNAYYLASAFDEIWLQPSGDWGLFGISLETPFLRDFLDKIGIKPSFKAREEYKNAMSFLTNRSYGAEEKKSLQSMIDDLFGQKLSDIAKSREIPIDQLQAAVKNSPIAPDESLRLKLIDKTGYTNNLSEAMRAEQGNRAEFVHLADYAWSAPQIHGTQVAVVYASGDIMRGGKEPRDQFNWNDGIFADDLVETLNDVAKNPDIKAVIIAINSPGGSYLASDTIWNAIQDMKKSGKPVYAVMSDYAASGGYYIAMATDRIFASPGTITGSIGVIAGKISASELAQKLGIRFDTLQTGENAGMWSMTRDFTPAMEKKLDEFLDRSYGDFLQKAATARGLELSDMRQAAKGRVWTGQQALELGLIDGTGGWVEAEMELRDELELDIGDEISFEIYPKPKSPWNELIDNVGYYSSGFASRIAQISAVLHMGDAARTGHAQARLNWIVK